MSTLSAWTAHWQTTPWAWVETPIRPWTAADGASTRSRASPRTSSAGIPLARSASSGVNGSTAVRTASTPVDVRARARAAPECEHLPHQREEHGGVGARADEVVLVRDLGGLGAPRVEHDEPPSAGGQLAASGPGKSGTVHSEPLDAIGLWPTRTSRSVRSMSGTGRRNWWP